MHAGIQDDTSGGEEESGLMEVVGVFLQMGKNIIVTTVHNEEVFKVHSHKYTH